MSIPGISEHPRFAQQPEQLEQFNQVIRGALGSPEQGFGFTDAAAQPDGTVVGRMRGDAVPLGLDGLPAAGAIGVLADAVLGFALISATEGRSWSVSVEISLDFLDTLSAGDLHAVGRGTDIDGVAGFARGAISDSAGRTLAHVRQHGRYVPRPAMTAAPPAAGVGASATTGVLELLGATAASVAGGHELVIEDPGIWENALGTIHGGVAICAAEAAAAYATLDSPEPLRTTSLNIAFAKPMPGDGPIRFQTRALHRGRTMRMIEVVGLAGDVPRTFARVVRQRAARP